MITVRIVGGLGNQMFQYAYAKALEQKGYDVKIDISKFRQYKLHGGYQLDKFNIDLKPTSSLPNILSKIGVIKSVKEENLLFNRNLKLLKTSSYVKGYFQTEKYFSEIREILINQFLLIKKTSDATNLVAEKIISSKNTCSLHIRRGDYITDKKANSIHGTCDLEYYKNAVKLINKKYKNTKFFIFSDDINWTKENLNVENVIYIDNKTIPHEDMFLMSLCKHNITANSSFSWWGAWLNRNENKTVIAPKKWFSNKENEVACQNWIKI